MAGLATLPPTSKNSVPLETLRNACRTSCFVWAVNLQKGNIGRVVCSSNMYSKPSTKWNSLELFLQLAVFWLYLLLIVNGSDVWCIETLWNLKSRENDWQRRSARRKEIVGTSVSRIRVLSVLNCIFFCSSARNSSIVGRKEPFYEGSNYDLFRAPPLRKMGFCNSKYVKDALFTTVGFL